MRLKEKKEWVENGKREIDKSNKSNGEAGSVTLHYKNSYQRNFYMYFLQKGQRGSRSTREKLGNRMIHLQATHETNKTTLIS